jgi:endonuclease/exonuclease/phosphatase family metal-dependent hydrolase
VESPALRPIADCSWRPRFHWFAFLLICALAAVSCRTLTAPPFLAKHSPETIRVMTWNIGRDSIFSGTENDRSAQFARVMRALQPDVVCLQEVWRGSEPAAALLDTILPLPGGRGWQHHGVLDNVILSRSTLSRIDEGRLETRDGRIRGHAMALSGEGTESPLYLICTHFESRDAVVHRERQAALVASQVYDLQTAGGLPSRTPIVVLGDLNVVSSYPPHFLSILSEGRVAGRGPGFSRGPDWDGSHLEDVLPRHNGRGDDVWTWRNDRSEYTPAALDRILYTGSAATLVQAFVLNTTDMSDQELRAAGLEREDVMLRADQRVHDHLPVVADFRVHD